MTRQKIFVTELDVLRQARTVHQVFMSMNNDKFFQFATVFRHVSGGDVDRYDRDPANAQKIAEALDCLVWAVTILNDLLSLDDLSREADAIRCRAVWRIVHDVTGPASRHLILGELAQHLGDVIEAGALDRPIAMDAERGLLSIS